MYSGWTTEQLADRWIDKRDIQNLAGRYVVDLLLKKEAEVYQKYWSKREDVSLAFNDGYYIGSNSVKAYYQHENEMTKKRTALLLELLEGKFNKTGGQEDLFGMGQQKAHPIDNGVIELATDGKTAKGLWHLFGSNHTLDEYGAVSYWEIGYFAADFILEEGQWRLWHVLYAIDIRCPVGSDWAKPVKQSEMPEFMTLKDAPKPEYDLVVVNYVPYAPDRPFARPPRIPEPYDRFDETFSYGP